MEDIQSVGNVQRQICTHDHRLFCLFIELTLKLNSCS